MTGTGLSAEEFLALPDREPHTELIDGEIVVDSPVFRHQRIALILLYEIETYCRARPGRGEVGFSVDVPLGERDVFSPDVWWVPEGDRVGREARRFGWDRPPALVAEVRSPSTWRYDVGVKKSRYEAAGAGELWLVDVVSDTVPVHRRSSPGTSIFDIALEAGAGETLRTPLLPGLTVDVTDLFDR